MCCRSSNSLIRLCRRRYNAVRSQLPRLLGHEAASVCSGVKMAKPDKRKEALALLSRNVSQTRTAQIIGIDRRTLVRWLSQPEFKKELIENRRSHLENVLGKAIESSDKPTLEIQENPQEPKEVPSQLDDLVAKALCALSDIISHPETRNSERIKASEIVLRLVGSERVVQSVSPQNISTQAEYTPEERKNEIESLLQRREMLKAHIAKLKG